MTEGVARIKGPPRPIRVAIDVRIPAGEWGGIQQMAAGLASGLSGLSGDDEFVFLGYPDAATWLDPILSGRCRRIETPRTYARSVRRRAYDTLTRRVPGAARMIGAAGPFLGRLATPIASSDGLVEGLGVDVVHFITPQAFLTRVPSVYQIMDLVHLHMPDFFSSMHRRYRDVAYGTFAGKAALVTTMTSWTRDDLERRMGLDPAHVAVVPIPPALTPASAPPPGERLPGLADRYVLFPAQTWPHKNHLGLVEAAARLRDSGTPIQFVCTGRQTDHFSRIQREVTGRSLEDLVIFPGYVNEAQLADLYRGATALVFPSRFEGWGIPVVEAFAWHLPVACSDIPVLREVARGAALHFDPDSPDAIAAAVHRVAGDGGLRDSLREAGAARVRDLTWDRMARTLRALYRRVAGVDLTDDDRALLAPPTLAA